MLGGLLKTVFGSVNERILSRMQPQVDAINALEPELEALDEEALRARTVWLRERLAAGETLDDILVDAFATVREASKRTLGQRHYDVQLLGGMVLHQGKIAEMKTGEGKTLVSTLPVYLNALEGKGAHVVTVNDYLAKRDSEWMGQIYEYLGMTVGCIVHGLDDTERQVQYGCDITYGTNNEYGFDYLRDNMKFYLEEMVQREFNFAIVDEVDSILIDEARTPLIISGPTDDLAEEYRRVDALIPQLSEEHYQKDEKQRTVNLTEEGQEKMETLLNEAGLLSEGGMYDLQNISLVHHANQALRAHTLFQRDTDYIVKDNKVIIIDEFTGRMMEGRRYSDGLHQALEAKEDVEVQQENQTLASITFQNYFRLYPKLAGMTGTAITEAGEFGEIYGLEVIEVPTNRDMIRDDMDDEVYRTTQEKYNAILDQIKECLERKQPVLVGTVSIEKSEELSGFLKKNKIKHNVLNARHHEQEAYIIAEAGTPGTVTIATNMAGRGTDIQLGGNFEMRVAKELGSMVLEDADPKKLEAITSDIETKRQVVLDGGGLFVLGTERHESRRIDNQLRGRSGRQGDPGASKFFVSLEDDLMRIFGSERMDKMLQKLGLEEGEAIIHPWINKALAKAQEKVEERNFEIRKQLLRFDDVMNDQRKVIYEQRKELMRTDDVSGTILEMRHDLIEDLVNRHIPEAAMPEQWTMDELHDDCDRLFNMDLPVADWASEEGIAEQEICERIRDALDTKMAEKSANYGPDMMRLAEKSLLLQLLDQNWKDHLLQLDHLRQGIGLRAYGQRDPLNEYKKESFELFEELLARIRESVTSVLAHLEMEAQMPTVELQQNAVPEMQEGREDPYLATGTDGVPVEATTTATTVRSRQAAEMIDPNDPETWGKVPRNAPCPCGSGKKYKQCCGKI
ncbi:MAG: preprotein translocase subunit SecA [Rhodospirillaceae bacterium]|nr:preprotein translocase subunit SecA [Rhodospirillaceae bacterium]